TLLAAHKTQNHPSAYSDIVKLCRRHKIVTHFSNIIGFPDDTAETIAEHLDVMRGLQPEAASFYVLCPIPGTEQYDEFLAAGYITEPNMDRFDGTAPTWRHPNLGKDELQDLLFSCYKQYYSVGHIVRTAIRTFHAESIGGMVPYIADPLFSRFSARQRMH